MELAQIKKLRNKLGMTQSELSEKSGVSQSLIAKVESGKTEPGYSKARKIFSALEDVQRRNMPSAEDLMKKPLKTCSPNDKTSDVIDTMKKFDISQVPVIKGKSLAGLVTESGLLDHVFDKDVRSLEVKDVMLEAPPTVSPNTPESAITPLLKHFPIVVVVEKGKIKGIVTKSDVIMKAYM